jgi:AcrR family transcriptional regulator
MARTRSASAHQKVLDATFALMAERGVDATSMDAIAEASGVSKATIYKHWADKDALLLEMMAHASGLHARPKFDSGDTRADIVAVLAYRAPERAEMRERIMPQFLAYSARNPTFGQAWRNIAMDPPRRELTRLLREGIRKGELSPKIDLDLSLTMLLGPIIYWHVFLNQKKLTGNPSTLAEGVVDAFWKAFGVQNHALRTGPATRGDKVTAQ